MRLEGIAEAEASRLDETLDGLDDMDDEIRRRAEGPTGDTRGRV